MKYVALSNIKIDFIIVTQYGHHCDDTLEQIDLTTFDAYKLAPLGYLVLL